MGKGTSNQQACDGTVARLTSLAGDRIWQVACKGLIAAVDEEGMVWRRKGGTSISSCLVFQQGNSAAFITKTTCSQCSLPCTTSPTECSRNTRECDTRCKEGEGDDCLWQNE